MPHSAIFVCQVRQGTNEVKIHWNLTGLASYNWDIDHNDTPDDSRISCVTCHNPHGARLPTGEPTAARTMADLAISYGIYNDGTIDREYGYIGSGEFMEPGGDLNCRTCHSFGPGEDPPNTGMHTRYYRERLDLRGGFLDDRNTKTTTGLRGCIGEED